MSKQSNDDVDQERDEEAVARLLRIAGPRAEIPEDAESRVHARVLKEWQTSTRTPDGARVYDLVHKSWKRDAALSRAKRWILPMALAASVVLVATFMAQPEQASPVAVGTVARIISPEPGDNAIALGDKVYPGMTIETDKGQGISLLLARNESLRLGENSVLRIGSAHQFSLISGRVYADTGQFISRDGGLTIDTTFGSVTDVGTQFAVTVESASLNVAVREGRVDVHRNTDEFVAIAGERLRVARQGDAVVEALASNDSYWNWTATLAPVFDIENRSLLDFLKWAARETGRELVFEDNELRLAAMRADLHGSISGFSPLESIDSVLATTGFRHRVESDRIVIER